MGDISIATVAFYCQTPKYIPIDFDQLSPPLSKPLQLMNDTYLHSPINATYIMGDKFSSKKPNFSIIEITLHSI